MPPAIPRAVSRARLIAAALLIALVFDATVFAAFYLAAGGPLP